MTTATAHARAAGMFAFWTTATPDARRALVAAALGWMLDAFDVMLYALVLASLMADLGMDKATAGLLGSLTLLASAVGGLVFGVHRRSLRPHARADAEHPHLLGLHRRVRPRAERRRSSRSSACCSASAWAASGRAARRSCRRPGRREHRGKALGLMQSCVGHRLRRSRPSSTCSCCRRSGWRGRVLRRRAARVLHAVGAAQRRGAGDVARRRGPRTAAAPSIMAMFRGPHAACTTLVVTLMNACTMFAWWGFNLWVPAYLSLPVDGGGIGLTRRVDVAASSSRCRSACGSATSRSGSSATPSAASGRTSPTC